MLHYQLAPVEETFRSYVKGVGKRRYWPMFVYIVPAKRVVEREINCLMTVKDIKLFEHEDDEVLEDWFI